MMVSSRGMSHPVQCEVLGLRPAAGRRRGLVLAAVMVVMICALLIGTAVLFLVQSEAAGFAASRQATQNRRLAWSAIQLVTSDLQRQRDDLLHGSIPDVQQQFELYTTGQQVAVARLLPPGSRGEVIVPEAAKLDLNTADAERLAMLDQIDEALAERIINARDERFGGTFRTEFDLLEIEGVTAEMLYGPLEELQPMRDAHGSERTLRERMLDRLDVDAAGSGALLDLVTVYAFEPPLQRNGNLRINLNVPWSDELGQRIDDRFGPSASQTLQQIMESVTFDDDSRIYDVLNQFNIDPEEWPDIIDAITTISGDFLFGRVDINHARSAVLMTLPGIDQETADRIVQSRDGLSDERRSTIAWPAIEEIIEPEQYQDLANLITTRSWTFRVRIATGYVDAEDTEGPLSDPAIFDAVIDLAGPQPRVAYLRNITLLQTAATLASRIEFADEQADDLAHDQDGARDRRAGAGRTAAADHQSSGGQDAAGGMGSEDASAEADQNPFSAADDDGDDRGEMDFDFGFGSDPIDRDDGNSAETPSTDDGSEEGADAEPGDSSAQGQRQRVGRWKP